MIFKEAGIKSQYREDIRDAVWEKFIFICPIASVTSYAGKSFGEVIADKESRQLLEGLSQELGVIAQAQGVVLPKNFTQTSIEKIKSFPHDTKSSLQMDFEKGKKTEIESFTGYVVNQAKESGIEVPLHQMVYSQLYGRK
jgi:2-dehydropantoate 2-reductase